jgi:hypothetical protein
VADSTRDGWSGDDFRSGHRAGTPSGQFPTTTLDGTLPCYDVAQSDHVRLVRLKRALLAGSLRAEGYLRLHAYCGERETLFVHGLELAVQMALYD